MIGFDGWDREYVESVNQYVELFRNSMIRDYESSVEGLESNIASFTGRKHAVACASATDALYFSLLTKGIGPGDEVLVTDFSWISSATCILRVGATPVFCDIDPDTYHISLDSMKRMWSKNVKAVVLTHLFGYMSDTRELEQWCREHDIIIIEDAAQSLGSSLDGRKAGTIGEISSFSFNSNKVISGINGGGILVTDNEQIAERVRGLRRHGKGQGADFAEFGQNSKMYYLNSEIIRLRLRNLGLWQYKRNAIAEKYNKAFKRSDVFIQKNPRELQHNYHKYVIRLEDKDTRTFLRNAMKRAGIKSDIKYEQPISENSMFANGDIEFRKDDTKVAHDVSRTILSIPCHAWLKDEEINTIIETVNGIVG